MSQVYRSGQPYGTGHPARLTPHEVRTQTFAPRRRGVDADQVREFQARVADELTILYEEARLLSQENDRLGRALRDWQRMHAREEQPAPPGRHVNEGHW